MSRAFCCEVCDSDTPLWRLERHGDVALTWACAEHVSTVLERLQRDWEITEISVFHSPKMREWAEILSKLGPAS